MTLVDTTAVPRITIALAAEFFRHWLDEEGGFKMLKGGCRGAKASLVSIIHTLARGPQVG